MSEDVRVDDLAVLYVGLAHGVDGRMHFNEFTQIADHLLQWRHPGDRRDVLQLVDDAVSSYAPERVDEAIDRMRRVMSEREKRAVLEDLSEIALADRRFLREEAEYIHRVSQAWDIHASSNDRGAYWTVLRATALSTTRDIARDITVLYLSVAFEPDREIEPTEIEEIERRVGAWIPDAPEARIEAVVREALAVYAKGLTAADLAAVLSRVNAALPSHQSRAMGDDLRAVARADGELSVDERAWIAKLESALTSS